MAKSTGYKNLIELLQGTLDMLILQTLRWGSQHGYAIVRQYAPVQAMSFRWKPGRYIRSCIGLRNKGGSNPNGKSKSIASRVTLDHVTGSPQPQSYEIVGIAGDANYLEIREAPQRIIYLAAFREKDVIAENLALRTTIDPEKPSGDVRFVVGDVLKTVSVARITTLTDRINASIIP
jgi:hypothetical protein